MKKGEHEADHVVSTRPKWYGSIGMAKRSSGYSTAIEEDSASGEVDERPLDMRTTFLGKGIIATGVLMFFAVVVTLAQSHRETGGLYRGRADADWKDWGGSTLKASSTGKLTLQAVNEYGPNDHYALALYGLQMIIEPYRETTLFVEHSSAAEGVPPDARFHWLLVAADDSGSPVEGAEVIIDSYTGSEVKVEVHDVGSYFLLVQQFRPDGQVVAEARVAASCKYVRREIRKLNDEDRNAYFEAMRIVYTIDEEEGQRKYGEDFHTYTLPVAYHSSVNYCYHVGMQFLTSHAAFDILMERALQLINPKVALATWDFLLDSELLGTEWTRSEVFSVDYFGNAHGDPNEHYQIKTGWFANISNVYDPHNDIVDSSISPVHNPFGYIYDPSDYTQSPGVTRSHSFCEMEGEYTFPTCSALVECFNYSYFPDWANCLEAFVDMEEYLGDHPEYSRGLLTFVLEFIAVVEWPDNKLMSDYNECSTVCTLGESCGCECLVDVFSWTHDEIRSFMDDADVMSTMNGRYGGDVYIDYDDSYSWPYGFKQDGVRLPEEETTALLRMVAHIGCQPGSIGGLTGGPAPLDPIFWVLHPIFEKALHVAELSPFYSETMNFTWVDDTCYGSGLHQFLPFTEEALGFGDGTEYLTNAELLHLLNPESKKTTYIYDDFLSWGYCDGWDPCPSCSTEILQRTEEIKSGNGGVSIPSRASNARM